MKTLNTRDIYSPGSHSAQGPLVTSVCLQKSLIQLDKVLNYSPGCPGSSSPDWP